MKSSTEKKEDADKAFELRREETLEQLKARGYDLVYISSHETECALCKQFQGKVFSISGKNPKFPPLSEAIDGGLFHTGCMHVISLASEEKDRFVGSLQDKEGEEARRAEIDRQAKKHKETHPPEQKKRLRKWLRI